MRMSIQARATARRTLRRRGILALAAAAGICSIGAPAGAASLTWDGGDATHNALFGGNGTWDLATPNWDNGAADVPWTDVSANGTDVAVFSGAPGTVTLNTNLSALGLQFTVPNYTVAGTGTLTLGASGISAGTLATATTTVSANVALAASQSWNVGANATLVQQTGVVSGTGALTAAGAGTLTLNGANTFTGPLNVNAGVVQTSTLGITTAAQGIGKSNALNLNGGTFRYTGASFGGSFAPTVTVGAGGGTMDVTGGFVFFGGTYAGTGTLTVINSNNVDAAWILQTSASPSFAGNIVLGNGVGSQSGIQVRGGGTNPLGTGTVTINAGGLLTVDTVAATVPNNLLLNGGFFGTQTVAATYTGDITLQSNSFIGSPPHVAYNSFNATGGAIAVNGLIHGSAGLTKASADTATFNFANTYTGPTFVAAGTLVYAADESALTGLTTINNGATLQLSRGAAVAPAFNVAFNGGTLNVVAAAAGSNFNVPSTWTPGGAERNYKSTYGTSGTANLNFPTGFAARAAGTVNNFVLSGGAAGTPGSPGTLGTNNITIAGQAAGFFDQGTFFNGGTASANYAYYDGGGFLRGINWGSDSGSTTAAGGASLASATYARTTAAVTGQTSATFTGLNIVNTTTTAQAFTLTAGATVQTNGILRSGGGSGLVTVSGGTAIQPATGNAELVIRADTSTDPLTITTPIIANGTNAVTKSGNGTLVLGAASTYTGNTNVNAGVVQITSASAIPANTTTVVNPGGTFDFNGQNISASARPFTVSGPGSPTSFAALVNTSSAEGTVGAVTLAGDTTVGQTTTKLNFGLTLNGGGFTLTTVTNGTGASDQTDVRVTNALSNLAGINVFDVFRMEASQNWAGTITINNGGTVDTFNTVTMNPSIKLLNGGKLSVGGGTPTWTGGTVTLVGASTIDTTGGNMTINHTISGTGSFTKTSANTLTLGGNNTFTTPITVSAGALATSVVGAPTAAQGIGQSGALVLNGGTFRYTGTSNGSDAGTTAGTNFAPTITVGASGGTLDNSGAAFIFYNGNLVGSGALTVIDSSNANHQWLVTGSSPTYSGNVTVGTATANSAFLQYRSSNPLPFGTGTITVQAGGTVAADNGAGGSNPSTLGNSFVLSGGILGTQAPAMTYTGPVTLTATSSVGHVANGTGAVTLAGVVSGAGGLNIIGGSTVTLTNANIYLGPTSIAAPATLAVSGSGTTGGPASTATVTVPQGAFLNLAVAGIQAGQTLQVTNSGSTPEVTLASGVNDTINMLILSDGTNTFTLPPGTYGSTSSPAASDANITADGLNPNSFFAGTGIVTVTTPEPASAALLALAGAGLLARRRRRRA